jgi:hypothetical protein
MDPDVCFLNNLSPNFPRDTSQTMFRNIDIIAEASCEIFASSAGTQLRSCSHILGKNKSQILGQNFKLKAVFNVLELDPH